ncbi:hypothetical protein CJP72_12135 [Citrobacter sp. NCU1]|uniref:hypothetical protein n=1 Tax=Citrobacter sp. NCU1 TaxID=2026683 RepID=UPI0013910752|nr:hypothetical protein [Citrobacter sp. NCU1]NDO81489.1 hypothetical protein [Citrobacter sp. NCU1]
MINNKKTDERLDNESLEMLITIGRKMVDRHAREGDAAQQAVHTVLLKALLELQERRKTDSAYPVAWTAKDVRNSQLATRVGIYERIYGSLRECPGPNSIYSVAPSGNEHVPHGICAHVGCISFYCNFGHLHLGEPDASQGRHTHSLSGGKNDA